MKHRRPFRSKPIRNPCYRWCGLIALRSLYCEKEGSGTLLRRILHSVTPCCRKFHIFRLTGSCSAVLCGSLHNRLLFSKDCRQVMLISPARYRNYSRLNFQFQMFYLSLFRWHFFRYYIWKDWDSVQAPRIWEAIQLLRCHYTMSKLRVLYSDFSLHYVQFTCDLY